MTRLISPRTFLTVSFLLLSASQACAATPSPSSVDMIVVTSYAFAAIFTAFGLWRHVQGKYHKVAGAKKMAYVYIIIATVLVGFPELFSATSGLSPHTNPPSIATAQ